MNWFYWRTLWPSLLTICSPSLDSRVLSLYTKRKSRGQKSQDSPPPVGAQTLVQITKFPTEKEEKLKKSLTFVENKNWITTGALETLLFCFVIWKIC